MTRLFILGTRPTRVLTAQPMALLALLALLTMGLLGACGQRGNLVLPTEPAAQNRATLPQVLLPLPRSSAASPAALPAALPTSAPAPGPVSAPTPAASAAP